MIGKAIAHESDATFFNIPISSLMNEWLGVGEKLVRTMFAVADIRAPSVVFIDEVDSLLSQQKSEECDATRLMKNELLQQFEGAGNQRKGRVLIIGATNLPQELDKAARRRFEKRLYIPLPSEPARKALMRNLLREVHHSLTDDEITRLAKGLRASVALI